MIFESPIVTMPSFGGSTTAYSDTAQYITKQTERWWSRLQNSHALGLDAKGVFDELFDVWNQCSSPDWDGYGALPVTYDAFMTALSFLKALPLGTKAPAVGAEPDGHITLEWYRSPRRLLSVSVSPEGISIMRRSRGEALAMGRNPTGEKYRRSFSISSAKWGPHDGTTDASSRSR